MEELEELKRRMAEERPQPWEAFPDIGLYMDQIISYMPRQLIHYGEGELLTSAMVNNYIKDGLLPRADGKRYSRIHLAYLTAICVLKRVLSVKETSLLVGAGVEHKGGDGQAVYAYFCEKLDATLSDTADRLDTEGQAEDLPRLALNLALRSYADRLACERVLDIMAERAVERPAERTQKGKNKSKQDN